MSKILVTGGAGFIGSHLVDKLILEGHEVTIFDNLDPQIHPAGVPPKYLNKKAKFIKGDIRNRRAILKALDGAEIVFHLAASVGIGQSMYQIKKYVEVNIGGSANIFDILINQNHKVKKIIIPGSATSYGECAYRCSNCGIIYPPLRSEESIKAGYWDPVCHKCAGSIKHVAISEEKPLDCRLVYALTKKWQEELMVSLGKTYRIPVTVLRLFNVYGPRQSLFNSYAGVIAVFSSRLKAGNPPIILEDGLQTRDFVFIDDVVKAFLLAMKKNSANFETFNVGTGESTTIKKLAEILTGLYGKKIKPLVKFAFRKGDARHSLADNSKIKAQLGWQPTITLESGLKKVYLWDRYQPFRDRAEKAFKELVQKNLFNS